MKQTYSITRAQLLTTTALIGVCCPHMPVPPNAEGQFERGLVALREAMMPMLDAIRGAIPQ